MPIAAFGALLGFRSSSLLRSTTSAWPEAIISWACFGVVIVPTAPLLIPAWSVLGAIRLWRGSLGSWSEPLPGGRR